MPDPAPAPAPDPAPSPPASSAASPTLDRIDRALARIEAAAAARTASNVALVHRHETLRTRMAEAVAALDAVIAREADA